MLLEGNWTNKEIPQYFEGMKSVGQDDVNGHKVKVLSYPKKEYITKTMKPYDAQAKPIFNFLDVDINNEGIAISSELEPYLKYFNNCGTYEQCNNLFDYYRVKEGYWVNLGVWGTDDTAKLKAREVVNRYIGECEGNKKEILLNEPLRSLPNGVKDRFVKIGGKWFIERNCMKITFDGSESMWSATGYGGHETRNTFEIYIDPRIHNKSGVLKSICDRYMVEEVEDIPTKDNSYRIVNDIGLNNKTYFLFTPSTSIIPYRDLDAWREWLSENPITIIVECNPTYEPLEIEPTLNTYNDTTHISNNSIIPCNMQIKNTGYNAIIKPSTLYTVAVDTNKNGTIGINLGGAEVTTTNNVATITTPGTLTDDSFRLYG